MGCRAAFVFLNRTPETALCGHHQVSLSASAPWSSSSAYKGTHIAALSRHSCDHDAEERREGAHHEHLRRKSKEEESLGSRLPPGQYQTKKWPVLHYGSVPNVDIDTWRLSITGLVAEPRSLTFNELLALPRKTVHADVHCVTRWSLFDSDWEGIPFLEVAKLVQIQPEAALRTDSCRARLHHKPAPCRPHA